MPHTDAGSVIYLTFFTGVLSASIYRKGARRALLEVEVHLPIHSEVDAMFSFQREVGAHAAQVVIRLDTLQWIKQGNSLIGELTCIDGPLSTLPHLQSVTLETMDKDKSAELVQYLPLLRNSGMLRRRSCAEALEQARHARDETSHPDEVAGEHDHTSGGCIVGSLPPPTTAYPPTALT